MTVSDRTLQRLAWCVWWFFLGVVVVNEALLLVGRVSSSVDVGSEVMLGVVLPIFPLVGLLILRQQPRNTIGWVLQSIGLVWGLVGLADNYARYGLLVEPGSVPRPDVAAAVANVGWVPGIGLMGTFLIMLYPDGRLPSPRWRPVAWVSGATIIALTVAVELAPGDVEVGPGRTLPNPLAVTALADVVTAAQSVLIPLLPGCIVASAACLVRRFHGSRGVERQQLKWLTAAAALVASLFFVGVAGSLISEAYWDTEPAWVRVLEPAIFVGFALLPVSIGTAVLRHGLYSIDVVINRALVYGTLTATLAAAYLGSVLLLQLVLGPFTDQSDLAVAGSTLAAAALFRPARTRIQDGVDRRFYRSRYDAARTLESFSSRLRDEVDLASVSADLRTVVRETVQPAHVSLWLRNAP